MGIPTRETFQRLEPCEVKVSSTVLRGEDAGNGVLLPDDQYTRSWGPTSIKIISLSVISSSRGMR